MHYTPLHLVDFVLDRVLPWDGNEWNLKVLDPACGSGIFLVKAFQRLVHRWKAQHPGVEPDASDLRRLLERNLLGVDINPEAVRVAAFSLYLAMCDEIDPRKYWTNINFPLLRTRRLLAADFFAEDLSAFSSEEQAETYDVVVGNAPWGKHTATALSDEWAETNDWPISNRDIGPLFLSKAAKLLKSGGCVAMIQPTGVLLLNATGPALKFRARLFSEFQVHEVVNLSALRFDIFANAVWPSCIVSIEKRKPDQRSVVYVSPKGGMTKDGSFHLRVEPLDIHGVIPQEAITDPTVWSALIWGQRRDLMLLRKLRTFPSLSDIKKKHLIAMREGIIRGKAKKLFQDFWVGKRILRSGSFDGDPFIPIRAHLLPENTDFETDWAASRDFSAFALPQLIIKQSWHQGSNRFQAFAVKSNETIGAILCEDSFVSLTSVQGDETLLRKIWATINSDVAAYFLLLTSGQFAAGIPKPLEKEMRALPIPIDGRGEVPGDNSLDSLDLWARDSFQLNEAEKALVDDLFNVTLRDFKGGEHSPGRTLTTREGDGSTIEPELGAYSSFLLRVLESALGKETSVSATIFQEEVGTSKLPLRLIAIRFGSSQSGVTVVKLKSSKLFKEIRACSNVERKRNGATEVYYGRVLRSYTSIKEGRNTIPTVLILKPDQRRYWTRSAGLHDGDAIVADLNTTIARKKPSSKESK